MSTASDGIPPSRPGILDRFLRLFSDVRPGESGTVLLLFLNIFTILVGYYVIKTVREPLVLTTGGEIPGFGGAEIKSFSSAGQAFVLMGFIPLYSWLASRVDRVRLIVIFNLFFIVCIEAFYFAGRAAVPYTGIAFFVFVGIFNNSVIAQFWSFGNDVYARADGERLFPIIVLGMTSGTIVGAKIPAVLFGRGVDAYSMMQVGVVALVVSVVLYLVVDRREGHAAAPETTTFPRASRASDPNGFALIFRSRYLLLIALTLVLANWVNTTGEYVLDRHILERVAAMGLVGDARETFIGEFRANFFFWVNIVTTLVQAFVASRLLKHFGIAGVVLALPVVAFGAYGLIAAGAGLAATRWAKTAENSTDYSIMNTAKATLWLPTAREEKYKAKQATDTFFVRIGDVLSALLVFAGTSVLALGTAGFAVANIVLIVIWIGVSVLLVRENRRVTARSEEPARAA
jgi:ATP:ADP antiporter, AAA family